MIIGAFDNLDGGFLRLGNANALPTSAKVSIGTGYLDIGNNNVTLGELMYANQLDGSNWNTTLNANNGVIGSGTLRVLGDINVMGQSGGTLPTRSPPTSIWVAERKWFASASRARLR